MYTETKIAINREKCEAADGTQLRQNGLCDDAGATSYGTTGSTM
jgi:hypothetical protein